MIRWWALNTILIFAKLPYHNCASYSLCINLDYLRSAKMDCLRSVWCDLWNVCAESSAIYGFPCSVWCNLWIAYAISVQSMDCVCSVQHNPWTAQIHLFQRCIYSYTVNHIFLTVLYFSDLETHQNLTYINFSEQR